MVASPGHVSPASGSFTEMLIIGFADLITQREMVVAALSLLIYDWFVTLEREIRYIWRSGSSITKYIFLSNRYVFSWVTVFAVYAWSGQAKFLSPSACKIYLGVDSMVSLMVFINLHLLVTLRAWALWSITRPAAILIWGVFAGYVTLQMVASIVYIAQLRASFISLSRVCFAPLDSASWLLWVPGVLYEIFLFVLTVAKALQHARSGIGGELLSVTYRDAFLFFMFITFNGSINLIFWAVGRPTQALVFRYFSTAICQTAGGHLILNLIEAGGKSRRHVPAATTRDVDGGILSLQNQSRHSDPSSRRSGNVLTNLGDLDLDSINFVMPTLGTVTFGGGGAGAGVGTIMTTTTTPTSMQIQQPRSVIVNGAGGPDGRTNAGWI